MHRRHVGKKREADRVMFNGKPSRQLYKYHLSIDGSSDYEWTLENETPISEAL